MVRVRHIGKGMTGTGCVKEQNINKYILDRHTKPAATGVPQRTPSTRVAEDGDRWTTYGTSRAVPPLDENIRRNKPIYRI